MVEITVVDHENDDAILLHGQTENRLISKLTSKKATMSIELVKLILLFVLCIVVGLLLSVRTHTTTTPATPVVPTVQNITRYEYKITFTVEADLEQRLNELSEEGWILDHALREAQFSPTNMYRHMMYLKRPKEL